MIIPTTGGAQTDILNYYDFNVIILKSCNIVTCLANLVTIFKIVGTLLSWKMAVNKCTCEFTRVDGYCRTNYHVSF